MKVNVIIPFFNSEKFISQTLESVWSQSFKYFDIILINDSSTDGTVELLKRLKNISPVSMRILHQKKLGSVYARNYGITSSSGEIIAFVDSDDIWEKDYLKIQLDALNSNQDIGYVVCHFKSFLDHEVMGDNNQTPYWVRPEHLVSPQPGFLPSCLVVRRSVFNTVGLFDERLDYAYDMDWFTRARGLDVPYLLLSHQLVKRRIHLNNKAKETALLQKNVLTIIRNNLK